MENFALAASLILPWLLGIVWLRASWLKPASTTWPTLLGYGYLAGLLFTTLVMRLLDASGIRLGFSSIALALALLIATGIFFSRKQSWRIRRPGVDWLSLSGWKKFIYALLLFLIVTRLAGLGLEILWRPLFPWDAWSQWATKARVWYETGQILPFVQDDIWLEGKFPWAYTDAAPHYPPTIPLIQAWMNYGQGAWNDTLMNLPWLFCAVALGLAFYGQARQWQIPPLFSLLFTYFLLSLPMLNVHIALAGYADLFMGAFYGLAAIAFFHWVRNRDFWQGSMALLFAMGCILIKQPGIAWAITFLPALLIMFLPRATLAGTFLLAAAVLATLLLFEGKDFYLLGYHLHLKFTPAWQPFRENMMAMDNWHLLWYLVPAALLLSIPRLYSLPYRSMTTLVFTAFSFLLVVFFFTHAQKWAEDFTLINRAFLHMIPMLVFYIMILFRETARLPAFIMGERQYGWKSPGDT